MDFISTDWRSLFNSWILERGEKYYYDGNVTEIEKKGDHFLATVQGLDDYEVEILIEDGLILDMVCSCPYFAEGNNCKHEAAVLYKLEKEKDSLREHFKEQEEEAQDLLDEFRQKMETLDKKDLVDLLVEQARENPDLALRFHTPVEKTSKARSYGTLEEEVTRIQNEADRLLKQFHRVNELNDRLIDLQYDGYSDYYGNHQYYSDYGDGDLTQERVDNTIADIERFTKELLDNPVIWSHPVECFHLTVELFKKADQYDNENLELADCLLEPLFSRWEAVFEEGLSKEDMVTLRTAYMSALKNTRTYNYYLDEFLPYD